MDYSPVKRPQRDMELTILHTQEFTALNQAIKQDQVL